MTLSTHLLHAHDPYRTMAEREAAWHQYELEAWASTVMSGRLRICDLEDRLRPQVAAYIQTTKNGGYR